MKKKLFLVITKSNFGGAQGYVYDLATSFNDSYDVTVICGGSGVLVDKLAEKNIRTISLQSLQRDVSIIKDVKSFFELLRIFKKEKPDIVHLNSSKIGGLGGLAARISGTPKIIFTGHGWAFNEPRPFLQKKFILFLHWTTIMLSHVTIAVSNKTKKDICTLPFVSKKIKVIYNTVSPIDFLPREKAREMLGIANIPTNTLVIGTISELHKNKGLDIALRGFNEFREKHAHSHFVIIGGGEQKTELESYIKQNRLSKQVTLTGFIKDASKYLKAFDIFSLTSRTEALPYVPLEAGLAGLPVIATKVGGIPEIIDNGVSGILIDPEKPSDFARALVSMIEEPRFINAGENLLQRVKKDFSHDTLMESMKSIYE